MQVEEGLIISLQFTVFNIEDGGSTCAYDHLTITDGDGTTLMEKSCGSTSDGNVLIGDQSIGSSLPANITSSSNIVKMVFSTDNYDGGNSGWSVTWRAVTPGECQQHVWIFLDHLSNLLFLTIMVHDAQISQIFTLALLLR